MAKPLFFRCRIAIPEFGAQSKPRRYRLAVGHVRVHAKGDWRQLWSRILGRVGPIFAHGQALGAEKVFGVVAVSEVNPWAHS